VLCVDSVPVIFFYLSCGRLPLEPWPLHLPAAAVVGVVCFNLFMSLACATACRCNLLRRRSTTSLLVNVPIFTPGCLYLCVSLLRRQLRMLPEGGAGPVTHAGAVSGQGAVPADVRPRVGAVPARRKQLAVTVQQLPPPSWARPPTTTRQTTRGRRLNRRRRRNRY